ncbi:MAG: potassium channel protein [Chloroflexi bacterium]|nr:potassium channel protein [Chloroflexota bacterium]
MSMELKKRLTIGIILLLLVFITGIAGYKLMGHGKWSLLDSTYMTVITLSTVGYGEVLGDFSNNPMAKIFTIFLILIGIGILTFTISNLTAFLVEGELSNALWRQKMDKKIKKLNDHFIVCGAGDIGILVIDELKRTGRPYVAIDKDPEVVRKFKETNTDVLIIEGDASDDEIMEEAGIKAAHGLACAMGSDQENLFVAVAARFHNPNIRIIAQCTNPADRPKFLKAGVNSVVSAHYIGALRIASELIRPHVVTFLDAMLRDKKKEVRIEEVTVYSNSPLAGKSLKDTTIREKTGLMVLAMRPPDTEDFIYCPLGDEIIPSDGVIVVFGHMEGVEKLKKMIGSPPPKKAILCECPCPEPGNEQEIL